MVLTNSTLSSHYHQLAQLKYKKSRRRFNIFLIVLFISSYVLLAVVE